MKNTSKDILNEAEGKGFLARNDGARTAERGVPSFGQVGSVAFYEKQKLTVRFHGFGVFYTSLAAGPYLIF